MFLSNNGAVARPTSLNNTLGIVGWIGKSRAILILFIITIALIAGLLSEWAIEYLTAVLMLGAALMVFQFPIYAFYLLLFVIPVSAEIELPMGLTTDVPGEPLLWLLFLISVLKLLRFGIPDRVRHLISLILLCQLGWLIFSSMWSLTPLISWKYVAAKIWFVLPGFLFTFYIPDQYFNIRWICKFFVAGCLVAGLYYIIRFYGLDFDFDERVRAGSPIWRNHVNYCSTLLVSLPMIAYLRATSFKGKLIYSLIFLGVLVMIYFAFARIAYVVLALWLVLYLILKFNMIKHLLLVGSIGILVGLIYLKTDNYYLSLAPEYDKTVTQHEFDDLVNATHRGQDISSMERVYRWVAGAHMIVERPIVGFGPGGFYTNYQAYALTRFRTFVSDNPERSGIHSYFLMVTVEQGVIGHLLWCSLLIAALICAQKIYQKGDRQVRQKIWLAFSIIVIIIGINTINDMIEVIKIGIPFYLALAIIVRLSAAQKTS